MADPEAVTPDLNDLSWSPLLDDHLEMVTALNARIQSHPWTLKHWQSSQLPNYRNWIILEREAPIAYISFLLAADAAELMNIGVAPSHQRRGLGCTLLAVGIGLLPEQVNQLYLEVRQSNKSARSLYESLGFRVLARRANYYPVDDERREDALVYTLENDGSPLKHIDFYQESGKLVSLKVHFPEGKGVAR